jgi:hypothetical protein
MGWPVLRWLRPQHVQRNALAAISTAAVAIRVILMRDSFR